MANEWSGQVKLTDSDLCHWFLTKQERFAGVVLIVHGLNHNPTSWKELITYLNEVGFHVCRLALKGHRVSPFEEMHEISVDDWINDFTRAYRLIKTAFTSAPVYLLGYSLGGLLGIAAQLREGCAMFERQVLLAPALVTKHYTKLAVPLCSFLGYLPPRSQLSYVANRKGTTKAAYRALFQLEREVRQKLAVSSSIVNLPTKILMRRDDELISFRRMKRLLNDAELNLWSIKALDDSQETDKRNNFKHLIVDSGSAGQKNWEKMTAEIGSFYLEGKSFCTETHDESATTS